MTIVTAEEVIRMVKQKAVNQIPDIIDKSISHNEEMPYIYH